MAVDGTYRITIKTPMGAKESLLTFKTEGNSLSGQSESEAGVTIFAGGTVNGNDVQWVQEVKTMMGKMKIPMKAVVDGDSISGEAKTPMGAAPFEGRRV